MKKTFFLFDMDGVLLKPLGYHESLRTSVRRIGLALGAPKTELSHDQIAHLEALGVTNEWDSLAICTALCFLHVWSFDPERQLIDLTPKQPPISNTKPDFDSFLDKFTVRSPLPCKDALIDLLTKNPGLSGSQKEILKRLLVHNRDIEKSPVLAAYQETVLGSEAFAKNYHQKPRLNIQSFLLNQDKKLLTETHGKRLRQWLQHPSHHAGIMTNRPCSTPPGYQSSPEAELGAKLIGLEDLPLLGSGILAWFAVTQKTQPDFIYLKPNPVHTLALLQMCLGHTTKDALHAAADLCENAKHVLSWQVFQDSHWIIFEDAAKGLQSGEAARDLLNHHNIRVRLTKVGVSENQKKIHALSKHADLVIPDLNHFNWEKYQLT